MSCSAFDDMEHMKNTTNGMASTTDKMASTTDKMASTTDQLNEKTGSVLDATLNMYIDMRQGNSWMIRDQAWHNLLAFKEIPAKLAEAGAFFQAMEAQLWKNEFFDDIENLEVLHVAAIDQFFRKAQDLIIQIHKEPFAKKFSTNPFSQDNRMKSLYALAATSHMVNPNEEAILKQRGIEKHSMLKLIQDSLEVRDEFNELGKDAFPPHVAEVLLFEDAAVYMLRLRSNFLAAMAFGKISGLDDENNIVRSMDAFGKMLFGWTADMKKHNLAEVLTYTRWIDEATRACDWVREFYESCKLNDDLYKLLKKMSVKVPEDSSDLFKAAVDALQISVSHYLQRR